MSEQMAERISVIAGPVSVGRRLLMMRTAGMAMVLCAATLATLVFAPGAEGRVAWTAVVGVSMVVASAVMGFQGSMLSRQLVAERAGGYSTDPWAVSARPEVAPGTSVAIRTAGSDPNAPGAHREMTKWARDIQRGSVRAMPDLKRYTLAPIVTGMFLAASPWV